MDLPVLTRAAMDLSLFLTIYFAAVATATTNCTTDSDCSLNGICTPATGRCACDAEWLGPKCETLNLLPTIPENGFQPVNSSSWGGSLILDPTDGRVHMFAAFITEHCGLLSWKTNSEIVHLVAASPLGPFKPPSGADEEYAQVVPRFAHNPTIHRNADGRYLLYHIGCGASPAACPDCVQGCTNGSTPQAPPLAASDGSCNGPHWTGLRTSMSLNGPWRDEGEVTFNTTHAQNWITNPCVVPASETDNTTQAYLLYRQSQGQWPQGGGGSGERLGWAVAQDCASTINCTYVDKSPVRPVFDCNLEDQYLWRDHRGNFHALTHKNCDGGGVSGHMFSADGGTTWQTSPVAPYNDTIALKGGGSIQCGKRARPMLLIENGRPKYLSTGASYAGTHDHTFTSMQEIGGSKSSSSSSSSSSTATATVTATATATATAPRSESKSYGK